MREIRLFTDELICAADGKRNGDEDSTTINKQECFMIFIILLLLLTGYLFCKNLRFCLVFFTYYYNLVIMKGFHSAMSSRRRTSSSGAAGLLHPLLGACLWAAVVGYKPVIIVHGLFDSSGDFKNLQRFINEVSDQNK